MPLCLIPTLLPGSPPAVAMIAVDGIRQKLIHALQHSLASLADTRERGIIPLALPLYGHAHGQ